jgi:hypothetical protein
MMGAALSYLGQSQALGAVCSPVPDPSPLSPTHPPPPLLGCLSARYWPAGPARSLVGALLYCATGAAAAELCVCVCVCVCVGVGV